jgi:glycosyltransferase involved in cell wall biosynthesis
MGAVRESALPLELIMVIPCFNESQRLEKSYWDFLIEADKKIRWYFVDDGSTDSTYEQLKEFNANATVIRMDSNGGKGEAIRIGLLKAQNDFPQVRNIGYVDADMAFNKEEVLNFCRSSIEKIKTEGIDAVIASRVKLAGRNIERSNFRHFFARVVATILGGFWKEIPYDTQCGLKVFGNTESLKKSLSRPFLTRWIFDIELFMRIMKEKKGALALFEQPLHYWREIGDSKVMGMEYWRIARELVLVLRLVRRVLRQIQN